jgi:outer membrane protein OmpA-like peptidoglycan-associated protein
VSFADTQKAAEIAEYMKQNQSLKVGIDGFMNPRNNTLSNQRVSAVQASLVKAGMPTAKIETGAFGDPSLRRDGRVEVLFRTGN